MNLCPGKSVGAIIKNSNDEYLVLYRKKHPISLALPAGHIDENETPENALKREVLEETGLEILNFEQVLHQIIKNSCSRGYTAHDWFVYEISLYRGEPKLMEPDKHGFVKFMNRDEIRSFYEIDDMDPAWKEILLRLVII